MSAIKYEGEFMTFLCGFDGEPTVQDAWSAAIKLMEEKFKIGRASCRERV